MEINVLRKDKNELEFEIEGEDSSLPEVLVHKLNQFSEVEFAAYRSEHPMVPKPKMFVRVKRGDPAKSVVKAVEELTGEIAEFRKLVSGLKA